MSEIDSSEIAELRDKILASHSIGAGWLYKAGNFKPNSLYTGLTLANNNQEGLSSRKKLHEALFSGVPSRQYLESQIQAEQQQQQQQQQQQDFSNKQLPGNRIRCTGTVVKLHGGVSVKDVLCAPYCEIQNTQTVVGYCHGEVWDKRWPLGTAFVMHIDACSVISELDFGLTEGSFANQTPVVYNALQFAPLPAVYDLDLELEIVPIDCLQRKEVDTDGKDYLLVVRKVHRCDVGNKIPSVYQVSSLLAYIFRKDVPSIRKMLTMHGAESIVEQDRSNSLKLYPPTEQQLSECREIEDKLALIHSFLLRTLSRLDSRMAKDRVDLHIPTCGLGKFDDYYADRMKQHAENKTNEYQMEMKINPKKYTKPAPLHNHAGTPSLEVCMGDAECSKVLFGDITKQDHEDIFRTSSSCFLPSTLLAVFSRHPETIRFFGGKYLRMLGEPVNDSPAFFEKEWLEGLSLTMLRCLYEFFFESQTQSPLTIQRLFFPTLFRAQSSFCEFRDPNFLGYVDISSLVSYPHPYTSRCDLQTIQHLRLEHLLRLPAALVTTIHYNHFQFLIVVTLYHLMQEAGSVVCGMGIHEDDLYFYLLSFLFVGFTPHNPNRVSPNQPAPVANVKHASIAQILDDCYKQYLRKTEMRNADEVGLLLTQRPQLFNNPRLSKRLRGCLAQAFTLCYASVNDKDFSLRLEGEFVQGLSCLCEKADVYLDECNNNFTSPPKRNLGVLYVKNSTVYLREDAVRQRYLAELYSNDLRTRMSKNTGDKPCSTLTNGMSPLVVFAIINSLPPDKVAFLRREIKKYIQFSLFDLDKQSSTNITENSTPSTQILVNDANMTSQTGDIDSLDDFVPLEKKESKRETQEDPDEVKRQKHAAPLKPLQLFLNSILQERLSGSYHQNLLEDYVIFCNPKTVGDAKFMRRDDASIKFNLKSPVLQRFKNVDRVSKFTRKLHTKLSCSTTLNQEMVLINCRNIPPEDTDELAFCLTLAFTHNIPSDQVCCITQSTTSRDVIQEMSRSMTSVRCVDDLRNFCHYHSMTCCNHGDLPHELKVSRRLLWRNLRKCDGDVVHLWGTAYYPDDNVENLPKNCPLERMSVLIVHMADQMTEDDFMLLFTILSRCAKNLKRMILLGDASPSVRDVVVLGNTEPSFFSKLHACSFATKIMYDEELILSCCDYGEDYSEPVMTLAEEPITPSPPPPAPKNLDDNPPDISMLQVSPMFSGIGLGIQPGEVYEIKRHIGSLYFRVPYAVVSRVKEEITSTVLQFLAIISESPETLPDRLTATLDSDESLHDVVEFIRTNILNQSEEVRAVAQTPEKEPDGKWYAKDFSDRDRLAAAVVALHTGKRVLMKSFILESSVCHLTEAWRHWNTEKLVANGIRGSDVALFVVEKMRQSVGDWPPDGHCPLQIHPTTWFHRQERHLPTELFRLLKNGRPTGRHGQMKQLFLTILSSRLDPQSSVGVDLPYLPMLFYLRSILLVGSRLQCLASFQCFAAGMREIEINRREPGGVMNAINACSEAKLRSVDSRGRTQLILVDDLLYKLFCEVWAMVMEEFEQFEIQGGYMDPIHQAGFRDRSESFGNSYGIDTLAPAALFLGVTDFCNNVSNSHRWSMQKNLLGITVPLYNPNTLLSHNHFERVLPKQVPQPPTSLMSSSSSSSSSSTSSYVVDATNSKADRIRFAETAYLSWPVDENDYVAVAEIEDNSSNTGGGFFGYLPLMELKLCNNKKTTENTILPLSHSISRWLMPIKNAEKAAITTPDDILTEKQELQFDRIRESVYFVSYLRELQMKLRPRAEKKEDDNDDVVIVAETPSPMDFIEREGSDDYIHDYDKYQTCYPPFPVIEGEDDDDRETAGEDEEEEFVLF
jgi:hypothetical protein